MQGEEVNLRGKGMVTGCTFALVAWTSVLPGTGPHKGLVSRPGKAGFVSGVHHQTEFDSGWTAIAVPSDAPKRRCEGCCWDPVRDQIYMYGGESHAGNLEYMDRYDPATNTWTSVALMSHAHDQIKGVYCKGHIYAISGVGAGQTVEEYDIATNTWRTRAPIPTPMAGYAASAFADSLIYVLGGQPYMNSPDATTAVQIFNPALDTWISGTAMPDANLGFDACIIGDTIYIPGGNCNLSPYDTLWTGAINPANPAQITWSKEPGTIAGGARSDGPCAALNGKVYYFGGLRPHTNPTDSGYVFDPATGSYDTLPTYPTTVCYCQGVARQNAEIYGLAGYLGDTTLAGYYRLRLIQTIHDVGVLRILGFPDLLPTGDTVTPSAWVRNTGTQAEGFRVMMRIDTVYTDWQDVYASPGESVRVSFSRWIAQTGVHTAKCSTLLADDGNLVNDTGIEVFRVGTPRLSIASWNGMPDTTDSAATVTPVLTVHNRGTVPVDFSSTLHIAPHYTSRQSAFGLAPGDSVQVTFGSWTPLDRGRWPACCSLVTEGFTGVSAESVFVRVQDAGARAIVWPSGDFVDTGFSVPEALIRNYSNAGEEIPVTFSITDSMGITRYQNAESLRLAPGDTGIVRFGPWDAAPGAYVGQAITSLAGDVNPANDRVVTEFQVIAGTITLQFDSLFPADTITAGTVMPSAVLEASGTVTVNVSSLFDIFRDETVPVYRSDTLQSIFAPGRPVTLTFAPDWNDSAGSYRAQAVVFNYARTIDDTMSGRFTVLPTGLEESGSNSAPRVFALDAPSPNPSRDAVTIRYALPKAADISLMLYDATGKLRATLDQGRKAAGRYSATFDFRDSRFDITSGIYFVRLKSFGFIQTRKVVIA
jgi:N-acetylneuraminic acid mutarotase